MKLRLFAALALIAALAVAAVALAPEEPAEPRQAARPAAEPAQPRASLEAMIGQMLVFGFHGARPDQEGPRTIARQLASGKIGGVMFLDANLATPEGARRLVDFLREAGEKAPRPPFFLLDQEGGEVQRLGPPAGVKAWPSARSLAAGPLKTARQQYAEMAAVLDEWGFNVNLGPVVDLHLNPANPIIGAKGRSFSADPEQVIAYARAFIEAHRERGLLTALKHFPGHGSSRTDSHLGFTDISGTWRETELAPYRALIREGYADMVMVGHLHLDRFEEEGTPASLSQRVVEGLLREELGYNGVVISDDMEMGAIAGRYPADEAAIRAIRAGVDLLIVSNTVTADPGLPETYIAAIAEAARDDPDLRARIEQSWRRILALKQRLAPEARPGAAKAPARPAMRPG